MYNSIINENIYSNEFFKMFSWSSDTYFKYSDVTKVGKNSGITTGTSDFSKKGFYAAKRDFIKFKDYYSDREYVRRNENFVTEKITSLSNQGLISSAVKERILDGASRYKKKFIDFCNGEEGTKYMRKNAAASTLMNAYYQFRHTYLSVRMRKSHFIKYIKSFSYDSKYSTKFPTFFHKSDQSSNQANESNARFNKSDGSLLVNTNSLKSNINEILSSTDNKEFSSIKNVSKNNELPDLLALKKTKKIVMNFDYVNAQETRFLKVPRIIKDPIYGSFLFSKFINKFMISGDKVKVQKHIYRAFTSSTYDAHAIPIEAFFLALEKLLLNYINVNVRMGREISPVPLPVRPSKKFLIALSMLVRSIKGRNISVTISKKGDKESIRRGRLKKPLTTLILSEFRDILFREEYVNPFYSESLRITSENYGKKHYRKNNMW